MAKYLKVVSSLALIGLLSACGGGGSGSSSSSEKPSIALSLPVANLAVDEGDSTTFSVNAPTGATVTFEGNNATTIRKEGDNYVVTASQVNKVVTDKIQVRATQNGSSSPARTLNVVVNNTSAEATVTAVVATLSDASSLLTLGEDAALFTAIVESLYLQSGLGDASGSSSATPMSFSEKESLIEGFNPQNEPHYNALAQRLNDLEQVYSAYQKGQVPEAQLESALASTQSTIQLHAASGAKQLSPLFNALYPNVDIEAQTVLAFSSEAGRYSRFIGDASFGMFENGTWKFNEEFGLLRSVVPTTNNSIGFCEG